MQITDLLAQTGGIESIARQLGIDPEQAATAASALAPAIVRGFQKRETSSGGGLADLLGQLGGGSLLDQVLSPEPTDVDAGNEVLGQIFGSKEVSRNVAAHAASQSGLSADLLKKMLPMLVMLIGGYLAQGGGANNNGAQAGGGLGSGLGGGLGGLLGGLLGGALGQQPSTGGGAQGGGNPGGLLGSLNRMLDADGDGSALDDILRMVNKGGR